MNLRRNQTPNTYLTSKTTNTIKQPNNLDEILSLLVLTSRNVGFSTKLLSTKVSYLLRTPVKATKITQPTAKWFAHDHANWYSKTVLVTRELKIIGSHIKMKNSMGCIAKDNVVK